MTTLMDNHGRVGLIIAACAFSAAFFQTLAAEELPYAGYKWRVGDFLNITMTGRTSGHVASYTGGKEIHGSFDGKVLDGTWMRPNVPKRCKAPRTTSGNKITYWWGTVNLRVSEGNIVSGHWDYCGKDKEYKVEGKVISPTEKEEEQASSADEKGEEQATSTERCISDDERAELVSLWDALEDHKANWKKLQDRFSKLQDFLNNTTVSISMTGFAGPSGKGPARVWNTLKTRRYATITVRSGTTAWLIDFTDNALVVQKAACFILGCSSIPYWAKSIYKAVKTIESGQSRSGKMSGEEGLKIIAATEEALHSAFKAVNEQRCNFFELKLLELRKVIALRRRIDDPNGGPPSGTSTVRGIACSAKPPDICSEADRKAYRCRNAWTVLYRRGMLRNVSKEEIEKQLASTERQRESWCWPVSTAE